MRIAWLLATLGVLLPAPGARAGEGETPYAETPCPVLLERIRSWLEALPAAAPGEREAIVERLVRVGPAAWSLLGEALSSPVYQMVEGALLALGRCSDPEAARRLAGFLADRRRILNLRVQAIESLGEIGSSEAAGVLVEHARGDEPELHQPAVRALARSRAPEGIDGLLRVAREDRSLRAAALGALAERTGRSIPGDSIEAWERWWMVYRYTLFESEADGR